MLPENVRLFEPAEALFVDNENPLLFYENIIDFSLQNLKKEGWLYFEIHEKYGKNLVELLERKGFFNITLNKDINGKDRIVKAQKNE